MEKKEIEFYVDNLIALCHIIDKYEEFKVDLSEFLGTSYNRDLVFNLWLFSKGEKKFVGKKVKNFYQKHKDAIDEINKYFSIVNFINFNYDPNGKKFSNSCNDYFYQYLVDNKDKINQILVLLNKIKELGFSKINFNEKFDFTDKTYGVSRNFFHTGNIVYLDNIEIIPNYESNYVGYKSTGSNYKIFAHHWCDYELKSDYSSKIYLNSLLFDPNRLPKDYSKESLYYPIIVAADSEKNNVENIQHSVDYSVSLIDLIEHYNHTHEVAENLNNESIKNEALKVLAEIAKQIVKLQNLSTKYDDAISNDLVTKEKLNKEKEAYLIRRRQEDIDMYVD